MANRNTQRLIDVLLRSLLGLALAVLAYFALNLCQRQAAVENRLQAIELNLACVMQKLGMQPPYRAGDYPQKTPDIAAWIWECGDRDQSKESNPGKKL